MRTLPTTSLCQFLFIQGNIRNKWQFKRQLYLKFPCVFRIQSHPSNPFIYREMSELDRLPVHSILFDGQLQASVFICKRSWPSTFFPNVPSNQSIPAPHVPPAICAAALLFCQSIYIHNRPGEKFALRFMHSFT